MLNKYWAERSGRSLKIYINHEIWKRTHFFGISTKKHIREMEDKMDDKPKTVAELRALADEIEKRKKEQEHKKFIEKKKKKEDAIRQFPEEVDKIVIETIKFAHVVTENGKRELFINGSGVYEKKGEYGMQFPEHVRTALGAHEIDHGGPKGERCYALYHWRAWPSEPDPVSKCEELLIRKLTEAGFKAELVNTGRLRSPEGEIHVSW